ncbi:SEC-C domain-containing protein [Burkholderia cepacia]|nr:SEC-C metal-binding domain-containing protein [Burkholderia cepacia]MCA7977221.1 SEC-C domain-containing protein [Burkholderia cepacia]
MFSIAPPPAPHRPFTVNASLYDKDGRRTIKIANNEFQAEVSNWDVEITGPRITVRSAPGKFDLVIRMEPPHRLVIERLDMVYKNLSIQCREGQDTIIEGAGTLLSTTGATFNGCDIAICVSGSSLSMGAGGGSMQINKMIINPANNPRRLAPAFKSNPPSPQPKKQGRNEECLCGSGKKYKHCHGRLS